MYAIIDNYDSFTHNLYQYLRELTAEPVEVFRNDRISVDELAAMNPAGIVISPGPGRPEEAGISVETIRRLAGTVSILGVCLGHQAIGYAFGARVVAERGDDLGDREPLRRYAVAVGAERLRGALPLRLGCVRRCHPLPLRHS